MKVSSLIYVQFLSYSCTVADDFLFVFVTFKAADIWMLYISLDSIYGGLCSISKKGKIMNAPANHLIVEYCTVHI